jgi:cell wall-associated NlpC family hydrolase
MLTTRRPVGRLGRIVVAAACAVAAIATGVTTVSAAPSQHAATGHSASWQPRWVSTPAWQLPRIAIGRDPIARGALVALGQLDQFQRTHDFTALEKFTSQRDLLAVFVASRANVSTAAVRNAWAGADVRHQRVLLTALTQVGVPYRFATMRPGESFDCSGLTLWAWQHTGVTLARTAGSQITSKSRIPVEQAVAGDLVYMPGHSLIYLGVKDLVLHAPYTGGLVRVDVLHLRDWYRFGNPLRG